MNMEAINKAIELFDKMYQHQEVKQEIENL